MFLKLKIVIYIDVLIIVNNQHLNILNKVKNVKINVIKIGLTKIIFVYKLVTKT